MSDRIVNVNFDSLQHETEKSYLVLIGRREIWLPKSQVALYKISKTVEMPEWLAEKNEI